LKLSICKKLLYVGLPSCFNGLKKVLLLGARESLANDFLKKNCESNSWV